MLELLQGSVLERATRLEIGSGLLLTQTADGITKLDTNPAAMITQEQADVRYVAKAGDIMTGNLTAPEITANATMRVGAAGMGYVRMSQGTATQIGYYEWYTPAGVRQGYMGWGTSGVTLTMEAGVFTVAGTFNPAGAITIPATAYFLGNVAAGYRFNDAANAINILVLQDSGRVRVPSGPLAVGNSATVDLLGDIRARRNATTGVIYFGDSTSSYLYWDGTNYLFGGVGAALHAGNYNSYAPTLTGLGATGTWGINISGNAVTVNNQPGGDGANVYGWGVHTAFKYDGVNSSWFLNYHVGIVFTAHDNYGGIRIYGNAYPAISNGTLVATFRVAGIILNVGVTANSDIQALGTLRSGSWVMSDTGVFHFNTAGTRTLSFSGTSFTLTGGYLTNSVGFYHPGVLDTTASQLAGAWSTTSTFSIGTTVTANDHYARDGYWFRSNGGQGWYNQLYQVGIYAIAAGQVRTYNGASFYSEGSLAAATTVGSGTSMSVGTNLFVNASPGYGVIGVYTPTVWQAVFSMGSAYVLTAAGAAGTLYGLAWGYDAAGGYALNTGYNLAHGLGFFINGGMGTYISSYGVYTTAALGFIHPGFFRSGERKLYGAWQKDDGTTTARAVASIIVSSAAPTTGDTAPDGTIWLRL